MSPTPGRSTLITSAPSQASSWVQVGPDCTCVKSRMRTPVRALPASPQPLVDGRGRCPLPFAFLAVAALDLSFTTFLEADRKSTRLNSSHLGISYAVFCLKKKKNNIIKIIKYKRTQKNTHR